MTNDYSFQRWLESLDPLSQHPVEDLRKAWDAGYARGIVEKAQAAESDVWFEFRQVGEMLSRIDTQAWPPVQTNRFTGIPISKAIRTVIEERQRFREQYETLKSESLRVRREDSSSNDARAKLERLKILLRDVLDIREAQEAREDE